MKILQVVVRDGDGSIVEILEFADQRDYRGRFFLFIQDRINHALEKSYTVTIQVKS